MTVGEGVIPVVDKGGISEHCLSVSKLIISDGLCNSHTKGEN